MRTRKEGIKKFEIFVDITYGTPLCEVSQSSSSSLSRGEFGRILLLVAGPGTLVLLLVGSDPRAGEGLEGGVVRGGREAPPNSFDCIINSIVQFLSCFKMSDAGP